MRVFTLLAGLLLLCACAAMGPLDNWPLDKMRSATVLLSEGGGHGSGVLIAPNYVLTANHVADGSTLTATFADGSKSETEVVFQDATMDVAVLRLKTPSHLATASLACRPPVWGEPIAAVGNSLAGVHNNIATGVVASTDPMTFDTSDPTMKYLVPINLLVQRGMSGGPVFDRQGNVLGFVDAQLMDSNMMGMPFQAGINLMISANSFCAGVKKAAGL